MSSIVGGGRTFGGASSGGGAGNSAGSTFELTIRGDITKDGCVDMQDWDIFAASYGYRVGEGGDAVADFNGDGWIDLGDYSIIATNWEMGCVP